MKPLSRGIPFIQVWTLAVVLLAGNALLADDETPIDPVRGRALMQKWQRGETLTPEESAYLDRVRAEIRRRAALKNAANKSAATNAPASTTDWSSLVPLTDLTNNYKGQPAVCMARNRTSRRRPNAPRGSRRAVKSALSMRRDSRPVTAGSCC